MAISSLVEVSRRGEDGACLVPGSNGSQDKPWQPGTRSNRDKIPETYCLDMDSIESGANLVCVFDAKNLFAQIVKVIVRGLRATR